VKWQISERRHRSDCRSLHFPCFNEKGEIIGAVGIKRDVTEQKQIERQLRYQAQLLENVSDAVMAVDNDYIITSWNTAAEKLYGWTATEVLGKNIYRVLPTTYLNGCK
jgi:PAS domain-containing protein